MQDVRCGNCKRLLFKAKHFIGEVKCHGCKHVNHIKLLSQEVELTTGYLPLYDSGIAHKEPKSVTRTP